MVIPEEIDGYSVVEIENRAFNENQLMNVSIPNSVTTIYGLAFAFNELSSLKLPNNLSVMTGESFTQNQLEKITIPDSLAKIPYAAFRYNQITELTLHDNLTEIDMAAFAFNLLSYVKIPLSVTVIREYAFRSNILESIRFMGNRPVIDSKAFAGNQLEEIFYCSGTTGWPGEPIEVVTPQLDENCDSDNDGVKNTQDAFPFDPSETLDTDLDGIGNNTDPDDDNDGVLDEDDFAPLDNTIDATDGMLTYDIINDEIEITGCLEDCPSNLIIPEIINGYSVTSIKDSSFSYEELIDTVTLPQSIVSIGYGAFSFNNIKNVTIPTSVTSVGNTAFNANQLDIIRFSGNRPVIHPAAFSENQIQNIYYCPGTTGWPGEAIEGVMPQLDENCEPNTLNSYSILDVDQNGSFDALTDGLILIRYAYGFRGDALVSGVIASDAERTTAGEIEAHIQTLLP